LLALAVVCCLSFFVGCISPLHQCSMCMI